MKDLKVSYLTSPHFRNIYIYLLQNKISIEKGYARELQHNCQLHGATWTLIQNNKSTEDGTLPCFKHFYVQGSYLIRLLSFQSLWRSLRDNKVFPNNQSMLLLPKFGRNLCAYMNGCHICQLHKKGPSFNRPFQKRINLNVPALTKISMDI